MDFSVNDFDNFEELLNAATTGTISDTNFEEAFNCELDTREDINSEDQIPAFMRCSIPKE